MSENVKRQIPVFFDPMQKRWPRLRTGVFATGLILSGVFGILIASILSLPVLSPLRLQFEGTRKIGRPPSKTTLLDPRQTALREAKLKIEAEREQKRKAAPRRPAVNHSLPENNLTVGFYVNWDETSMSSLKENIRKLDMVAAEFLHLTGPDGNLKEDSPVGQQQFSQFVRETRPDLQVMAL